MRKGITLVLEDSFCSALNDFFFKVFVSPLRKALIDTTVMSVLKQPSCSSSNNASPLAI